MTTSHILLLILPAFQCKTEAKYECPVGIFVTQIWRNFPKIIEFLKKSHHTNTCCVKHVDLDTRLSGSSNGITTILYSCSIGFCNSSYQLSSLVRFKTTSLNWISLVMKVNTRDCKTRSNACCLIQWDWKFNGLLVISHCYAKPIIGIIGYCLIITFYLVFSGSHSFF